MVARRRRYYKTQIDGQLSFEDLAELAGKEDTDDEPVRSDGASPLGPVAAAAVRDDQRPGQLLLDAWARRRRSRSTSWPPNWRATDQPGEGYLAKAGRLTAARSQAEEIILPQQILLAPEPETSEDPEETGPPTASGERPLVIDRSHPLWAEVNAEQEELAQDS